VIEFVWQLDRELGGVRPSKVVIRRDLGRWLLYAIGAARGPASSPSIWPSAPLTDMFVDIFRDSSTLSAFLDRLGVVTNGGCRRCCAPVTAEVWAVRIHAKAVCALCLRERLARDRASASILAKKPLVTDEVR